ncbi:cysteine desulfurase family protein [Litorimonas sp. RW-G-Af-16]|uniref:cysteine desulfurase family protein n=1 Tax=Litorimonas sp. RW-G-Af-16 TaxID=3241168 RepID=UPI00390C6A81
MSVYSQNRVYLDHNATSPLRNEAREAMLQAFDTLGNPVSLHGHGRDARKICEDAREAVALAMGVCAQDLIFTGSGTESDNTAIHSAYKAGCTHMLVAEMDHPATINAAQNCGAVCEKIPCNADGQTDMDWLRDRLKNWDSAEGRPFVSITAANSETGVIQDISTATDLTHDAGGLILVDAVQIMGKMPMTYNVDYLSVSAHKVGGPQGVGALYVASDAPFTSLLQGGGQEKRRRAGTLNVAGIAGFGAAANAATPMPHLSAMRDRIETELRTMEPDITFFGENAPRLPNTSFLALPDVAAQTLLMGLDLEGVSVSTGTACSSGVSRTSRVVNAMGLTDKAPLGAMRVSLGYTTTDANIDTFLNAWAKVRRYNQRVAS